MSLAHLTTVPKVCETVRTIAIGTFESSPHCRKETYFHLVEPKTYECF